jgi:hypothetical protein
MRPYYIFAGDGTRAAHHERDDRGRATLHARERHSRHSRFRNYGGDERTWAGSSDQVLKFATIFCRNPDEPVRQQYVRSVLGRQRW